jgi:hypothetical protein
MTLLAHLTKALDAAGDNQLLLRTQPDIPFFAKRIPRLALALLTT